MKWEKELFCAHGMTEFFSSTKRAKKMAETS